MRFLKFFSKARVLPPSIEHPIFGRMQATLANEDGSYFWETPDPIATSKGMLGIFLDGPAEGPSEDQVKFWNWVYDHSEDFAEAAKPLLLERMQEFNIETRFGELAWTAIGLSPNGEKAGRWDMSFELPEGVIFTVYFEDGVPTVVSVDD